MYDFESLEDLKRQISEHLSGEDARRIVEEFQSLHDWPKDFNNGKVLRRLVAYAFEKGTQNEN